jgi:lipopolysaccharide assembly outer membrane protein LptD (OstA)
MRHRRWILLGLTVMIVIMCIVVARQKPIPQPSKPRVNLDDPARIIVKKVSLSLVDQEEVVRWELDVEEAKEYSEGMRLNKVRGRYFPDHGEPFILAAQTGEINKAMDRLVLSPDVSLIQKDYRIKGRQLVWTAKDEGVQLNGNVILDSLTMHGEGERLITDASLKRVRFEGQSVWRSKANLPKGGQKH